MLKDGEKGAILQRDKETYAVAPHIPCGVVSADTLRKLADVADKYNAAALKLTGAARIAIVGLKEEDIDNVWADLGMDPGAAVGLCVRSIKACPGTTFCKRGQQDSLGMGMALDAKYHGKQLPGKLKIGVSGCANQCSDTCIRDIGFIGMPKGWKVLVGGNGGAKPRFGQELVSGLTTEEAMELADKVINYFEANAKANQRIGAMLEKEDFGKFKAAVLGEAGE